jgi:shikimate dehydrogenase
VSRYAVIGKPVNHSKSPRIHSLFAKETEQEMAYEAIEADEESFDSFVTDFFAGGGSGLNITVPYKEKAFALAEQTSDRAGLARAVNTLYVDDQGRICGDNTDGAGLVNDIKTNHGFEIRGGKILILGAGGAVRGALASLIAEQPEAITIANRTVSRAAQIQQEFSDVFDISVSSYEELGDMPFDLIINGTSLSLSNELPAVAASIIGRDSCCYDMMYADTDTVFVSWSKQHGAALALDGLGMLIEQAAESFYIWRGIRPNTQSVIGRIRS